MGGGGDCNKMGEEVKKLANFWDMEEELLLNMLLGVNILKKFNLIPPTIRHKRVMMLYYFTPTLYDNILLMCHFNMMSENQRI